MSDIPRSGFYWQDRRRFLSMPIRSTHYAVNDHHISITEGLLRQTNYNIPLFRISSISCRCGLRQRLANQGDIYLTWRDGGQRTTVLRNIRSPLLVKDLILRLSEEAKLQYCYSHRRRFAPAWPGADDCDL